MELEMAEEKGIPGPVTTVTIEPLPAADEAPGPALAAATSVVPLSVYIRTYIARVRGGDSGVLPVIAGVVLISVVFQITNSLVRHRWPRPYLLVHYLEA